MQPYFQQRSVTIYHGDSRELDLPSVDLVVADPPYGLGKSWKRAWHGGNGTTRLWGTTPDWDHTIIAPEELLAILKKGKAAVVWGGNYYPLPPSRSWFVWDKLQKSRGADGELAWSNLDIAPKIFRMSRIDAYHNKTRFKKEHGAEKPVQLYSFIYEHAKPKSVLDPFMGSGNSIVAAEEAGINAVGVDIEEKWCECAAKRVLSCDLMNDPMF